MLSAWFLCFVELLFCLQLDLDDSYEISAYTSDTSCGDYEIVDNTELRYLTIITDTEAVEHHQTVFTSSDDNEYEPIETPTTAVSDAWTF